MKDFPVQLLSETSHAGARALRFPKLDVPAVDFAQKFPADQLAETTPRLPELAEIDVVRHFVNLSSKNYNVDANFYPLGSCTMKYNPKCCDKWSTMEGFCDLHPYQPESTVQGVLELLYKVQQWTAEIAGLPNVSLQAAAGAHGEFNSLEVAAKYFREHDPDRKEVVTPDAAHGTNPASAAMAGFKLVVCKSSPEGLVDLDDLQSKLSDKTAVFMITNPNTLGLFDPNISKIAKMVHDAGALVYVDGANMNAIMGVARPGDFGADMMHFNTHKTFAAPHGGGGPGAGPIAVADFLKDYLPHPRVIKTDDGYKLDFGNEHSIGKVRMFFGSVGVLVRMYGYIRVLGADGIRKTAQRAVLAANYLAARVKDFLPIPHPEHPMHEFVASAESLKKEKGISAMEIAKGLLDFGIHAPTIYFPMIVHESLMFEPTETEPLAMLDYTVESLKKIVEMDSEYLHHAPHTTAISRPDEVTAAKKPVLKSE